ncbi:MULTISPECIES: hypothetical protein [unclassified Rhizobium]|uniref:hypothetical protein n=1 Tax=unclassified Rhizobium TaxID=2613769 RepID=UPI0007157663|nr:MULTISPECIES: hypothetical protein [unclassified Rhizobium]KQS87465.1 hypothetical protein ASG42_18675 [Rhizobium sp. Leaf391]KQT06884.1 hypothetical protein ASG50_00125 [Rhizobium sp. Leaf386]KQT95027.1 hypothetical protein ASG68_13485 [Rhizobium sp. Leaf453]
MAEFFHHAVRRPAKTETGITRLLVMTIAIVSIGASAFCLRGSTKLPIDTVVCDSVKGDPAGALADWHARGVIESIAYSEKNTVVKVQTARWEGLDPADRRRIGVQAYCLARGSDLRGSVTVKGSKLEDLGTVIDGYWMR